MRDDFKRFIVGYVLLFVIALIIALTLLNTGIVKYPHKRQQECLL